MLKKLWPFKSCYCEKSSNLTRFLTPNSDCYRLRLLYFSNLLLEPYISVLFFYPLSPRNKVKYVWVCVYVLGGGVTAGIEEPFFSEHESNQLSNLFSFSLPPPPPPRPLGGIALHPGLAFSSSYNRLVQCRIPRQMKRQTTDTWPGLPMFFSNRHTRTSWNSRAYWDLTGMLVLLTTDTQTSLRCRWVFPCRAHLGLSRFL